MFLMSEGGLIALVVALAAIVLFAIIVLARCIVIVPQAHTVIVQRLGKYHKTLQAGFHMLAPLLIQKQK